MFGMMLPAWTALSLFFLFTAQIEEIEINTQRCPDDKPTLTHRILDEFGDERTIQITGGKLKITCKPSDVTFQRQPVPAGKPLQVNSSEDTEAKRVGGRAVLTILLNPFAGSTYFPSSKTTFNTCCVCKTDEDHKKPSSAVPYFNYMGCSPEGYRNCSGKQLSVGKGTCADPNSTTCPDRSSSSTDNKFPRIASSHKVCADKAFQTECDAAKKWGNTENWPMSQVKSEASRNFWEGDLSLWHNIFSDSYTLTAKNHTKCQEQNRAQGPIHCQFKLIGDTKPVKKVTVPGNCTHGWKVTVDNITNYRKTKMVCATHNKEIQWNFLLYNTEVKFRDYRDSGVKCVWPKWTGLAETKQDENCICSKDTAFQFPHPLKQKSQSFAFLKHGVPVPEETTTLITTTLRATEQTANLEGSHSLSPSNGSVPGIPTGSSAPSATVRKMIQSRLLELRM